MTHKLSTHTFHNNDVPHNSRNIPVHYHTTPLPYHSNTTNWTTQTKDKIHTTHGLYVVVLLCCAVFFCFVVFRFSVICFRVFIGVCVRGFGVVFFAAVCGIEWCVSGCLRCVLACFRFFLLCHRCFFSVTVEKTNSRHARHV